MPGSSNIRVFISYAWEDEGYRDLVEQLATRLVEDGIDARLDAWHAEGYSDIPSFMNSEIRNASRILVLCSPEYRRKVHAMEDGNGVTGSGWEFARAIASVWANSSNHSKIVAALFRGSRSDSVPTFLEGVICPDLYPDSEDFENNYLQVLQRLTGQTKKAPALGQLPSNLRPRTATALRGSTKPAQDSQTISPIAHVAKLPATDSTLIGRDRELATLNSAWRSGARFVQIIAPGGTGKTALITKWYKQYVGQVPIIGYSFYRQGTTSTDTLGGSSDSKVSSDEFLNLAMGWLELTSASETADAKVAALVDHLRAHRTLLILDGLEPLQNHWNGELRDLALKDLLRDLAAQNAGLVLCTSRVRLSDIPEEDAALTLDLDNLTEEDGARYLKEKFGVYGSDEDLRAASREYGNHALALTLLGTYLKRLGGELSRRFEIARLPAGDNRMGKPSEHAARVMQSYAKIFAGTPEGDILRALGFFDRPAEREALKLVMKRPLDDSALATLRAARLIFDGPAEATIDCHPLVREHFGALTKSTDPKGFREGHSRLFDHYCGVPEKNQPETLKEMIPLLHAVAHGCHAGRHEEARTNIYRDRILRGTPAFYLRKQLGASGTDLSLLAYFFDQPWRQPVPTLAPRDQSWLLGQAAFTLRSLGRLNEAIEPMRASAERRVEEEFWNNASIGYNNLSELLLTLGRIPEAIADAGKSVDYANRSGDAFWRMASRTTLADGLRQSASPQSPQPQREAFAEAARLFDVAERMQAERQPEFPILYAVQGYQYCDLLLDSPGNVSDVLRRATQTVEWAAKHGSLLSIGVDHLTLGRAHPHGSSESRHHLDQSVAYLRRAGDQEFLALALLARATDADLKEAHRIASRSDMRLHLTDYHLAMSRRAVKQDNRDEALTHLQKAETLIKETGYHRRDPEAAVLRQQLGLPPQSAQ